MEIFEEEIVQTLSFTEAPIKTNQILINRTDILVFTQGDEGHRLHEFPIQNLLFAQSAKYTISGHRTITQTLTFDSKGYRNKVGDVYQNFTVNQTVSPDNKWKVVNQVLGFSETVSPGFGRYAFNELAFTETLAVKWIRALHVIDYLSLAEYPVSFVPKITVINAPIPSIVPSSFVYFTFGSTTLTLRTPDFGNKESFGFTRIQRETRGGDLTIFKDPLWNFNQTFEMTFSYIGDNTARAMQSFVQRTLGLIVIFKDHEGNNHTGFINTPNFEIQKVGRENNTFTITFEVVFNP